MCRMLGVLSTKCVDATWPRQFKSLAKNGLTKVMDGSGHQDGWGMVYYDKGTPLYLGREPVSAWTDQRYDLVLRPLESGLMRTNIILAHVRRASPGSPLTVENTHPFTHGKWAFCHNGHIENFKPPLQIAMQGTTDSETLFKYMLPGLLADTEKAPENCMRDSIADARRFMADYKSLNFIITDGKSLWAYRDYNEKTISDYLITLKYCSTGDTVAVCSEPLTNHVPEKEWEDLKNKQMLVVGDDLRTKILQF